MSAPYAQGNPGAAAASTADIRHALECGQPHCPCHHDHGNVHCPAHTDATPSLSVTDSPGGKTLVKCHGGCTQEAVVARLRAMGLWPEREGQAERRRIVDTYDYRDAVGKLLYQTVRYDPKDFRQRRPDGAGDWIWNLRGVELVLYRLPEMLEAIRRGDSVYVVEGEKDADTLAKAGLEATTSPLGAGKWRNTYADSLRGASVVVLPDNDDRGRLHAQQVLTSCHGKAASLRLVTLPGAKDVTEWLGLGHTVEELRALAQTAPEWAPPPPGDGQRRAASRPAVELPELTIGAAPVLAPEAWAHLGGLYRDLVAPTTEASDGYHYAVFYLVLGATLGRSVWLYHAVELYPNFYTCLVGQTGIARKDTAWSRGRRLLNDLHADVKAQGDETPAFQIIPGIGSAEGLIDALAGQDRRIVLNEAELMSLLGKARQEGLSNLIPKLTGLYDCPPVETLKTRQKSVSAERPFLCIISGSTKAWLHRALTEKDIYGGFANRFCFAMGAPKPPMPNPPPMDKGQYSTFLGYLNDVRTWTQGDGAGEYVKDPETVRLFELWYSDFHRRCMADGMVPAVIARAQNHLWKLALLNAACNFEREIMPDHLEAAIAGAKYFEDSARSLFADFYNNGHAPGEEKLLALLAEAKGPLRLRDLYRSLGIASRDLEPLANSLCRVGLARKVTVPAEKGRDVECLEAV